MGKYITGNITPGTPNDEPFYYGYNLYSTQKIKSGLEEKLNTYIIQLSYEVLTSETTDNILIYGRLRDPQDYVYFFAVLDQDYNVLFATDEFSSGTKFNELVKFAYDDEGRVWGIDIKGTTTETGDTTPRYRMLLLNNPAIPNSKGEYEVVLRKAYKFAIGYNKIEDFFLIQKIPGEPIYYVLSNDYGSLQSVGRIIIIKINVGSPNELYQTTLNTGGIGENDSMLIEPYNDDYIVYYTSTMYGSTDFIQWVKGSSPSKIADIPKECSGTTIISSTKVAFTFIDGVNELWEFCLFDNGEIEVFDTAPLDIIGETKTYYINGLTFYGIIYKDSSNKWHAVSGCYDGNKYSKYDESTELFTSPLEEKWVLKNNYGLYTMDAIIIQSNHDTFFTYYLLNYSGVYSGTSYENYDSLVPKTARVTDNLFHIVFARQLYNSTYVNNTTTSTLEIPNTMLNNLIIKYKYLDSITRTNLVYNTEELTKNIYEKLYINFVNTINVIDKDTNTNYLSTGTNITTNINDTNSDSTTMNNKKIAKIKINYQDSTDNTIGIGIIKTDDTHYTITGTIYIDKEIETIDIISNDTTETYITLDGSNLEVGKYYTLSESLRIE